MKTALRSTLNTAANTNDSSTGTQRLTDRVVVFNDLVDSTPLLVELGDEAYTELLDQLDDARIALLDAHDGRLASLAGDGALMIFSTTDDAIAFAIEFNELCNDLGIMSRTGVHLGDVMQRRNGDLAGLTVHAAARIESTAPVGGVLVSADAAERSSAQFVSWGWAELKGIPGATQLMELVATAPDMRLAA